MELMFGNTCLSWVRKTLTLQYMCILVGLSQFCSFVLKWFDLVKTFPMKMAKTSHLCFQCDTPTPRRRSACIGIKLRLGGGPYAWANPRPSFPNFLIHLNVGTHA